MAEAVMLATGSARLRRWIILYAVAAMVAMSVAVAAAVVVPMQRHMVEAADRGLAHSLDLQRLAVGEALARLRDLASQITSRSVIRDALIAYNRGERDLASLRAFSADKLADALRLAPEMAGIVRLDRDGRAVVAVGEPPPAAALRAGDREHPEAGAVFVTAAGPRLTVTAPIFGPGSTREGTDVVLFNASAIAALVQDGRRLGHSWRSALFVAGPDGFSTLLPADRAGAPPEPAVRRALEAARDGGEPIHATDAGGNGTVAVAGRLPGSPWFVGVRMDAAELYYDVDRLMWRIGGGALGLAALGALGMVLVLQPLTGRMLIHADTLSRQVEEQRRTVVALQRSQRTLRTLSGGNQALIHAEREEDLLDEMCRIMAEVGGYSRAWVALNAPDGPSVVAHRTRDETASAAVPDLSGVAALIAAGEPLHVADVGADPRCAGVAAGAEDGAFLLLPLTQPGADPLGAVGILSRDASGFDGQERALLEEMVGDLAFGIRGLRMRSAWLADQERLERTLERTIQAIAATIEVRDPFTAGHQRRVGDLAAAIAREMGLAPDRVKGVFVAGIIHDIGKIAVPTEILSRPAVLSPLEFELVKAHAEAGAAIVAGVEFPWPVADAIAQHHERLDGSGYPRGLSGDAIATEARILAVADVVEAMTSHRPYRPAQTVEDALAEIAAHRGTLYDAAAVDACIAVLRRDSAAQAAPAPVVPVSVV